jgi:AhpD family alkylhydroperoxidase
VTSISDARGSRIRLLSEDEAATALEEAGIPPVIANLNISRALANSGLLTRVVTRPTSQLMARASLAPRLRELIILRVAWLNRCEYEWVQHYRFSKAVGVSDSEIEAVRDWRISDRLDEAGRAVLELTDVLISREEVSEDLWQRLVKVLGGEVEALEAAAIAGAWTMVAFILKTAAVPIEEGQPSWPPDGLRPDARSS